MKTIYISKIAVCGLISLNFSFAQLVVDENFSSGSIKNKWYGSGDVCITSNQESNGIPSCNISNGGGKNNKLPDKVGEAALRLTNSATSQKGSIIYKDSFPSDQGIKVTFTAHLYGDSVNHGDGMSFFLLDASIAEGKSIGGGGGSLGYACYNSGKADGIEGGYLGIGIDTYGSFSNPKLLTSTGPGRKANSIVVRGGGNVNEKMRYANNFDTSVANICKNGTAKVKGQPFQPVLNYPLIKSIPVSNLSDKSNKRTAFIRYELALTSKGLLSLSYSKNDGAKILVLNDIDTKNGIHANKFPALPSAFRFGFSASAGSAFNFHEISCFKVEAESSASDAGVNIIDGEKLQTSTQIYTGSYLSSYWSGQLNAHSIVVNNVTKELGIATNSSWNASCVLTGGACPSMGINNLGNALHNIKQQPMLSRTILTTSHKVYVDEFTPTPYPPGYWTIDFGAQPLKPGQDPKPPPGYFYPIPPMIITPPPGYIGALPTEPTDTLEKHGIPFLWEHIGVGYRAYLNLDKNNIYDGFGELRMAYLRGNTALESHPLTPIDLRKRISVLGDIINSGPAWVGAPDNDSYAKQWLDKLYLKKINIGSEYVSYKSNNKERTHVVYVGSNDGMLHGFRAGKNDANNKYIDGLNDGKELIAYVPYAVASKLSSYTDPDYEHEYYADETAGTGELYYNNQWHTWLVSGLGSGGKAIFALDITKPDLFSEDNAANIVKGEWNEVDLPNLGNTFGTPTITLMHDGRWAIIFGNGFDSDQGIAGVYMLLVDSIGNIESKWLSTGRGSIFNKNGIAHVTTADLDDDNITDYLYAGDLLGNIWRFDVSSDLSNDWHVSKFGQATASPLFSGNINQPITTKVQIHKAEIIKNKATRLLIIAGTGRKKPFTSNQANQYEQATQSIYAVWDWDSTSLTGRNSQIVEVGPIKPGFTPLTPLSRSDLRLQTITAMEKNIENNKVKAYRSLSSNKVCWVGSNICTSNNDYGWYLDFNEGKEQIIYSPIVYKEAVFVNTITTDNTSAREICEVFKPNGWTMSFNTLTGGSLDESVFRDNKGYFDQMISLKINGSNGSIMGIETGAIGGLSGFFYKEKEQDKIITGTSELTEIIDVNFGKKSKNKPNRIHFYKRI